MSEPNLIIRLGVPEDIHAIMDLMELGTEENALVPPNPMKILHEVYAALSRDHGLVGIITSDESRIEGVVILRITQLAYSDNNVLEEKIVFIHPDYRSAKGGRALKLCRFSKKVADELGLPLLIGVLSNKRTAGKIRMYEREFGSPAGAFFLYNGKTGGWKSETNDGMAQDEECQPAQGA